jgi:hypothetical protein
VEKQAVKILTTSVARDIVKRTAAELGMKEQVVASRIYEWFSRQDEVLVKGILGLLHKGNEVDVARLALERLAAGGKGKTRTAG